MLFLMELGVLIRPRSINITPLTALGHRDLKPSVRLRAFA